MPKTYTKLLSLPFTLDLRSIGLFRILLGVVLLIDLVAYKIRFITAFYSESGIVNSEIISKLSDAVIHNLYSTSLLNWLSTEPAIYCFFIFTAIAYILFAIGYKPKLFGILAFYCLWSIHLRNSLVLSGPDEILICFLFWSIFLPLDERYCVVSKTGKVTDNNYWSLASIAILLQIFYIYFFNAHSKTGFTWQEGTAISFALMEDLWVHPPAYWLAQFPALCEFLTYSTRVAEYSMAALIFFPLKNNIVRTVLVILMLTMHWSFFIFLDLGLFPLIGTAIAVILVPSSIWDKISSYNIQDKFKIKYTLRKFQEIRFFSPREGLGKISKKPVIALLVAPLKHLKTFVLICTITIIGYINLLKVDIFYKYMPHPSFFYHLKHTKLFNQDWAMYAPNPTINPGWIKITGLTQSNLYLDLKSGRSLKDDHSDLGYYKSYPWMIFAYRVCIYKHLLTQNILKRWAEYEFDQWNGKNPENKVVMVYIISYTKTIYRDLRSSKIDKTILVRYNL